MTRISELPRRDWTEGADEIADQMTDALRTPQGTMRLRPIQGVTLYEALTRPNDATFVTGGLGGGVYVQARVGGGKTIISALLPTVFRVKRAMVLVPAALVKKTELEFLQLRKHWEMIPHIRVVSYSILGQEQHANLLEGFMPELLVDDEAQKLKGIDTSAVARRVARYLHKYPQTITCNLSGSPTKQSLLDYCHLVVWSLGHGAPVPLDRGTQEAWAGALDASPSIRQEPDILAPDLGPGVHGGLESAQRAYRDRFASTPGVIVSVDAYEGSELAFTGIPIEPPKETDQAFEQLRHLWVAPDGWPMADARFEVWATARQLALGFYYRHSPWPPDDWFKARRSWCSYVRDVIEQSDSFDSELQVRNAVARGDFGEAASQILETWTRLQPTFQINKVPTWLSDRVVTRAQKWGKERPGIVWTEHRAFAAELAKRTGWAYYGEQGLDQENRMIEHADGKSTVIASVKANGVGRNLQQFNRNLITSIKPDSRELEQMCGRTHRDGQLSARVEVDYFVACHEHADAVGRAVREAQYVVNSTGQRQKIIDSNLELPLGFSGDGSHPAWGVTKQGAKRQKWSD